MNLVSEVILQPRQVQQVILTFRPSEPLKESSKEKDEKDIKQVCNFSLYLIHVEGDYFVTCNCSSIRLTPLGFTLFSRAEVLDGLYRLQDKIRRKYL